MSSRFDRTINLDSAKFSLDDWANLPDPHPHVYSQLTLLSLFRSMNLADPH